MVRSGVAVQSRSQIASFTKMRNVRKRVVSTSISVELGFIFRSISRVCFILFSGCWYILEYENRNMKVCSDEWVGLPVCQLGQMLFSKGLPFGARFFRRPREDCASGATTAVCL